MKKFKYRAESYIDYLTHLRDLALLEVKNAEMVIRDVEEKILESENKVQDALKRNSDFDSETDDIQWIQDNNLFLKSLRHHNEILKQELEESENIYSQKQLKLVDLQKKLKSVEKHREKKALEHQKMAQKKEQKNTDDLNAIRMGRSRARSIS